MDKNNSVSMWNMLTSKLGCPERSGNHSLTSKCRFKNPEIHELCYVPEFKTSLTKVLHFAIGKPMAYHSKFAVKRTEKSTLANYGKLSRAKHRSKKRSPASHKRMANNNIFTFHGVKASYGLPRYFSLQINKKRKANLPLFAKRV